MRRWDLRGARHRAMPHLCPPDALPHFLQPLFYTWSPPLCSLLSPLLQPLQHLVGKAENRDG